MRASTPQTPAQRAPPPRRCEGLGPAHCKLLLVSCAAPPLPSRHRRSRDGPPTRRWCACPPRSPPRQQRVPGELMKSLMSLVGSCESSSSSWLMMASAEKSSTSPPMKMVRCLSSRPKGSPCISAVRGASSGWLLASIHGRSAPLAARATATREPPGCCSSGALCGLRLRCCCATGAHGSCCIAIADAMMRAGLVLRARDDGALLLLHPDESSSTSARREARHHHQERQSREASEHARCALARCSCCALEWCASGHDLLHPRTIPVPPAPQVRTTRAPVSRPALKDRESCCCCWSARERSRATPLATSQHAWHPEVLNAQRSPWRRRARCSRLLSPHGPGAALQLLGRKNRQANRQVCRSWATLPR